MKYKTIAVDLDGTLIESTDYPYVSVVNGYAVAVLLQFQAQGGKVICFTCRTDDHLDLALEAVGAYGLVFDAKNTDPKENVDAWEERFPGMSQSNKPWADLYIDNSAWPCNIIGINWEKIRDEILDK